MDVNIMLFDGFETLDVFGPVEILARVSSHVMHYYSANGGIITSAQGTKIITESISTANHNGIFVIPGGRGTRTLINDNNFLNVIANCASQSKYCLSICTGSALLAKAGVLNGRRATSNNKAFDWACSASDKVTWVRSARWVVDGKFYTSSGVSAGMDMSLGFVSDLFGKEKANQIANDIEYIWNSDMEMDVF